MLSCLTVEHEKCFITLGPGPAEYIYKHGHYLKKMIDHLNFKLLIFVGILQVLRFDFKKLRILVILNFNPCISKYLTLMCWPIKCHHFISVVVDLSLPCLISLSFAFRSRTLDMCALFL